ncbi:hypothetical protein QBC36DRAFT_67526 [Triangularia setosa]|uniref:DUF4211 domain-containing protein n=1 Tax=Triangularia setosa TaxID=2587417 RepID=A0AAN6WDB1_9PEZI|nr:hypothetical protein QBC36DRAFT_67526 [Podospora setosa]
MAKPSKKKQQTLEATLGRPKIKPAVITPRKATPTKGSPSKTSVFAMPPPPAAASSSSPSGNFMTSSQVILSSARKTRSRPSLTYLKELENSSSATEDAEDELPVGANRQKSKGKENVVIISDDDDDDDDDEDELPTKRGKSRGTKPISISSSSGSPSPSKKSTPKQQQQAQQDEDDEDDLPIVTPASLRFNRKRRMAVDSDDSDDLPLVFSPAKKRRLIRKASSSPAKQQKDDPEDEAVAPTPKLRSSQTPRKPLSAKEKAREMLRRRRAGETIVVEDEEEEEEWEEDKEVESRKALYDTDSDNLALSEFEDEEDEEDEASKPSESNNKKKSEKDKKDKKKKKKLEKLKGESDDEGTEAEGEDLDDFVVEDDSDEPLGAPDELMQMPLQFTHHARKKLIEHFRDVVEWLVQYKINPGFAEKTAELYRIGWQKLDDEVRALASSKFTSSSWKPDFYKALRARPQYTSIEVGSNGHESVFGANCEACGRSGHPATWTISFSGTPYIKRFGMDFLDPIEPPSDSDISSSSQSSSGRDVDEDGNTIPPEDKTFYVGVVCNGNAEIAHTLIHWKHALLDWVESQLMAEGYMQPVKLAEREMMKLKKKYKLVDKIVEGWVADGKVRVLFGEFKNQLERARNQQTTGRGYRRG